MTTAPAQDPQALTSPPAPAPTPFGPEWQGAFLAARSLGCTDSCLYYLIKRERLTKGYHWCIGPNPLPTGPRRIRLFHTERIRKLFQSNNYQPKATAFANSKATTVKLLEKARLQGHAEMHEAVRQAFSPLANIIPALAGALDAIDQLDPQRNVALMNQADFPQAATNSAA